MQPRGGSPNELFQNAFLKSSALEPPSHDLDCCLDRAALLTQETNVLRPPLLQTCKTSPI